MELIPDRCAECAHEKLVAFLCKLHGFCPSCGARRMAETAAWLIGHVDTKQRNTKGDCATRANDSFLGFAC